MKSKSTKPGKHFLVEFCIDYTDDTFSQEKFKFLVNSEKPTANCQLPTANCKLQTANWESLFNSLYEKVIMNSLEQTGNSPEMIKDIGITILQP